MAKAVLMLLNVEMILMMFAKIKVFFTGMHAPGTQMLSITEQCLNWFISLILHSRMHGFISTASLTVIPNMPKIR